MSYSEEQLNYFRYRFSGYQPPLIQLDETGPAYWQVKNVHPYYVIQPQCWTKPAYPALRGFRDGVYRGPDQGISDNNLYAPLPFG